MGHIPFLRDGRTAVTLQQHKVDVPCRNESPEDRVDDARPSSLCGERERVLK
jgi:hypothetical protein